jgi:hypothetical protein
MRTQEDLERAVRAFPRAMDSACGEYFSASNCSYRMHKSKASTMRIVMFTRHAICNAYTLETSLAGARGVHFTQRSVAPHCHTQPISHTTHAPLCDVHKSSTALQLRI